MLLRQTLPGQRSCSLPISMLTFAIHQTFFERNNITFYFFECAVALYHRLLDNMDIFHCLLSLIHLEDPHYFPFYLTRLSYFSTISVCNFATTDNSWFISNVLYIKELFKTPFENTFSKDILKELFKSPF